MPSVQIRLNPYGWTITLGVIVLIIIFWSTGFSSLFSWTSSTDSRVSLRNLLSASIDLSQKAGRRVHDIFDRAKSGKLSLSNKDTKQSNHLTTRADFESHRIITFGLSKAFSNLRLVSEERDSAIFDKRQIDMPALDLKDLEILPPHTQNLLVPAGDITVWIDPLDATLEYTEALNEYVSVMVCVAVRGRPTLGVIYQPFANQLWWGWLGVGTSANIRPPPASKSAATDKPTVVVSRSHAGAVKNVLEEALGKEGEGFALESAGGSGYKTIRLLQRRAALYPHVTASRKWDLCAPHAVLSAAGGVMRSLADEDGADRLATAFGPPAGEHDMAVNGGFVSGLSAELVERLAPRLRNAKGKLSPEKAAL